MRELHEEPLAPRTTLRVGGTARRLIEVADEAEAEALLLALAEPFFVLGGGSNVVIADEGTAALVLAMQARGVSWQDGGTDEVTVRAAAGEPWDELVAESVAQGLAGIECLSGIPGFVGATPIQNVGAYGQQIADAIAAVHAFDLQHDAVVRLAPAQCGFAYRRSALQDGRHVVLAVELRLRRALPAPPRHDELRRMLAASRSKPGVTAIRDAVLALRRSKAMVVDDADPDSRSAGSFFLNPTVDPAHADAVARRAARDPAAPPMPRYPERDGQVKLSAAWLIERAGYARGTPPGPVGLSSKHALAIVNRGQATARQVVELAAEIQRAVRDRLGVALVPEPALIGFPVDVRCGVARAPLRTVRCPPAKP